MRNGIDLMECMFLTVRTGLIKPSEECPECKLDLAEGFETLNDRISH